MTSRTVNRVEEAPYVGRRAPNSLLHRLDGRYPRLRRLLRYHERSDSSSTRGPGRCTAHAFPWMPGSDHHLSGVVEVSPVPVLRTCKSVPNSSTPGEWPRPGSPHLVAAMRRTGRSPGALRAREGGSHVIQAISGSSCRRRPACHRAALCSHGVRAGAVASPSGRAARRLVRRQR